MSRGPAITATVVAVALVNIGVATLVVASTGQRSFAPSWVGGLVLALGLAAIVVAIVLWRSYLSDLRAR